MQTEKQVNQEFQAEMAKLVCEPVGNHPDVLQDVILQPENQLYSELSTFDDIISYDEIHEYVHESLSDEEANKPNETDKEPEKVDYNENMLQLLQQISDRQNQILDALVSLNTKFEKFVCTSLSQQNKTPTTDVTEPMDVFGKVGNKNECQEMEEQLMKSSVYRNAWVCIVFCVTDY